MSQRYSQPYQQSFPAPEDKAALREEIIFFVGNAVASCIGTAIGILLAFYLNGLI